MSDRSEPRHDRQYNQVVIAVSLVLAVSLLAISMPAISSALESGAADVSPEPLTDNESPSYAIGAGPVGESRVSPVGLTEGSDREVTPFRNQSNASLFTVQTEAPGYWRVDAYNTYDGEWVRNGDGIAYRSAIPASRPVTVQVEQNISVNRPAVALPGTYQPATVETNQTTEFTVSSETGLHPSTTLPANSTYTMGSYRYRPSPASLQDAGTDYPVSIEERYTQLPPEYSEDVAELGTVMTEDADTPYAKAVTISESLQESRNYSLSATHETDADPVEQFLFEMDEGDSTYFASSMVTLLRSQDVPARYVTGYSVGEPIGDNRYEVRQVNAHAWVEVYFPGHGWVAFDPTPTAQRLAVEDEAVGEPGTMAHVPLVNENSTDLGVDIDRLIEVRLEDLAEESDEDLTTTTESPPTTTSTKTTTTTPTTTDSGTTEDQDTTTTAPTETPTDDNSDGSNEDGTGDGTTPSGSTEDGTLTAELSSNSPAPGEQLTVTVRRDGTPVENASVWFNSKSVGVTNASGQVSGTVPYAKTLDVVASTNQSATTPPSSALEPMSGGGIPGNDTKFYAAVTELPDEPASPEPTQQDRLMEGNGSLLNSKTVSNTRSDGSAAVDIPPQVFQVEDESGQADENTTIVSVPVSAAVSMSVRPEPVVAGGTAIVQMQVNGQPVSDATVRVDGEVVGTTDGSGEYELQVPDDVTGQAQTVELRRGELTTQRSIPFGELALRATGDSGMALPGQTVSLQVLVGGAPLSDVAIKNDAGIVGTTNADGTIDVTLPVAQSTEYSVVYGGQQVEYGVHGMLVNAGFVSIASLGWVGLLILGARRLRRGETGVTRVEAGLERWGQQIFTGVLAIGSWLTAHLLALQTEFIEFWQRMFQRDGFDVDSLWAVVRLPMRLIGAVTAGVSVLVSVLRGILVGDQGTTAGETGRQSVSNSAVESGDRRLSIREAWWRFVSLVSPRVESSKTPTEVAHDAIDAGLPRKPIEQLLESFRIVEYGRGNPEEHTERATEAIDELEHSREEQRAESRLDSQPDTESTGER